MDNVAKVIISIEGLFFLIMLILLVFLIFRRIDAKKKEDFENRDN